ncbi:MAG: DUF5320 domain-containing protein [Cyclobacteriaceae bacterium]
MDKEFEKIIAYREKTEKKNAMWRSRIIAFAAGIASLILLFVVVFAQIQASEAQKEAAFLRHEMASMEEQLNEVNAQLESCQTSKKSASLIPR